MIQEARNRGSLAAEVTQTLEKAILRDKTISLELAEIDSAESNVSRLELRIRPFELDEAQYQKTGELAFNFNTKAQRLDVDEVVLATGFEAKRPGGTLIDGAIRTMDLPTATDGFPIVDRHLRWREGLFVMGPLAELEVGPVSRNISGARMAADRIRKSPELDKTVNDSNQRKRSPIARKSRRLAMDGLGRSV